MAIIRLSKPVTCCNGSYRYCCILKDNRKNRMDIICSNGYYACCYIHSSYPEVYRTYYNKTGKFENIPYPGIKELLQELRASGKLTMVATSKPQQTACEILEHFELLPLFDMVAGSVPEEGRYKKTEVLSWLLSQITIPKEQIVMIGDHPDDILGAKENGIDSIGVLYGFGKKEEIESASPTHMVQSVEELHTLLLQD